KNRIDSLFYQFQDSSIHYNSELTQIENYQIFEETQQEKIAQIREELIQRDLYSYHSLLKRLDSYQGVNYYIRDGEFQLSNMENWQKEYSSYPAYIVIDGYTQEVYPEKMHKNPRFHWITPDFYSRDFPEELYIGFTEEFLDTRIAQWQANKEMAQSAFYKMAAYLLGLMVSFIFLLTIVGRNYPGDKEINLNSFDRIYNDLNLIICVSLAVLWAVVVDFTFYREMVIEIFIVVTAIIATVGLLFVLSMVKHYKNKTFLKHTLIFTLFQKLFLGLKAIYDSGSLGVKIAIIIIGYPVLVALTFFIFPITIGAAVWLGIKKGKEFLALKEGVKRVKEGDLSTTIQIEGKGELAQLATDINSITDGLNKAVENEIKSERLKTELITNVSHDLRTPLTSIITYVDLLKREEDLEKIREYVDVLDQKSQRLKILTDDLFEAAKASSGNIPVNLESIDLIALLKQGLGELDERIQECQLDFRWKVPSEKVLVKADGRLLWRGIENLLSNIFKYALKGSRVYIEVEELEREVSLTFKNISAYELNISAEELLERFKRGDESRSSSGSGLGLSIVKSLVEIQKGIFEIKVDGDLFKATITLPREANLQR
ncbi:MAG: HAMP domain-containing histidine kinase, partial [Desulfitobacterium sp.]|nr:HAMP domain-containing histidine kinase [Desulfitobacterium sp.]